MVTLLKKKKRSPYGIIQPFCTLSINKKAVSLQDPRDCWTEERSLQREWLAAHLSPRAFSVLITHWTFLCSHCHVVSVYYPHPSGYIRSPFRSHHTNSPSSVLGTPLAFDYDLTAHTNCHNKKEQACQADPNARFTWHVHVSLQINHLAFCFIPFSLLWVTQLSETD